MTLGPDPGTGRSWRLTLWIGGCTLAEDVADRLAAYSRDRVPHTYGEALNVGYRVASVLGLEVVTDGSPDGDGAEWSTSD